MTQKWFKAADVCEMAELQPYVLRSWEKEFPGIGVQKSADSPRLVPAVGCRAGPADQAARVRRGTDAVGRAPSAGGERRPVGRRRQGRRGSAGRAGVGRADAHRERPRRPAFDSQAAVERAGNGRRRGRLSPRAAAPSLVKGARRSMAARSKATVASKRAVARKPARPAKRNKRASA